METISTNQMLAAEAKIVEMLVTMASHGVDVMEDEITFSVDSEVGILVGIHTKVGQEYSIPVSPSEAELIKIVLSSSCHSRYLDRARANYASMKKQFMNMLRVFGLDSLFPVEVKMKKLKEGINTPVYKTVGASGMDVESAINAIIKPGCKCLIPTGIALGIPGGYEIQVRPRSGMALKEFVTVLNTPGSIDSKTKEKVA